MKKLILFVLGFIFFSSTIKLNAQSIEQNNVIQTQTIYYENNEYLVITIIDETQNITRANKYTKTGSVQAEKYNNSNICLWTYTLTAKYTVFAGIEATCTSATYSTTINNSAWSFSNGLAYYDDNTAYGKGTFTSSTNTEFINLSLTCDEFGNLY